MTQKPNLTEDIKIFCKGMDGCIAQLEAERRKLQHAERSALIRARHEELVQSLPEIPEKAKAKAKEWRDNEPFFSKADVYGALGFFFLFSFMTECALKAIL